MVASTQNFNTVEEYISAHPDADPKALLDVLMQQNVRIREENTRFVQESRDRAEVEIDAMGNFKPKNLAGLWRIGEMYARSSLTPDHYRGKPADCAIAAQMALRCKVNILTFMQWSYVVHGKPGIESKLAIAILNASGQLKGRVQFKLEGEGKSRRCTAFATDVNSGERVEQVVSMEMAEAEKWTKNEKWRTMPDIMLQYRSAMFLARLHFPDVLVGMRTVEEIEDVQLGDPVAGARQPQTLNDLTDRMLGDSGGSGSAEDEPIQTSQVEAANGNGHDKEPVTEPVKFDLEGAQVGFNACATLTEVGKLEDECNGLAKSDSDKAAISGMADAARERIQSSRGTRSNVGKQKELAGA